MNEVKYPGGDIPEEFSDDLLVPDSLEPGGMDPGGMAPPVSMDSGGMAPPGGMAPGGMAPGGLNPSQGLGLDSGMGSDMDMGVDLGPDEKINRGNRGMLIAFTLILAVGGVIGFFAYKNYKEERKWEVELQKALSLPDGQFEEAMRQILEKSSNTEILAQAALELGHAKDKGSVQALAKAVTRGGKVGREAAKALAKIGGEEAKAGVEAIYNQMKQSEELAKAEYAWALCMLGDDRGFPPLLEAIGTRIITPKSLPEFEPDLIVRIGTTDKLVQMADSPDPMLKMYAAMELGFRTDGDVVSPLLKLVRDENLDVAEAAAISLGRTTDDRAGPALLSAMKSKPALRDSILNAITQSVGSPGLEMIYKNMQHPDEKYKVIGKFKKLKDPRSRDFLLTVINEQFPGSDDESVKQGDEIRNQALWILEELGDSRIAKYMYEKTQWEPVSEEAIPDPAVRYRQDDMARKIANGVISWFGQVRPDGAADYLMKIYKENEPYSNTPECAKRVKVDVGPLMDAMGRTGDKRFCSVIRPMLDKDEGFFFQAASHALARLNCDGIAREFVDRMQMTAKERKDEVFAQLLESRDWQMEDRLQERRNSIMALKFLGQDAKAAEGLMEIVMDTQDDQELRKEAAVSLSYVSDETTMAAIIEKLSDESIDIVARAALVRGLWLNPTPEAVQAMLGILEGSGSYELVKPAAIVVGEAADPANQERLVKLLDHADEHRQRAAIFALMLGGDVTPVAARVIEVLRGQEAQLVIRQWYEEHEVYLTKEMFESKRVYTRLINAKVLSEKTSKGTDEILWPWKHLMSRLKTGWADGPNGLTALEVRNLLSDTVRADPKYRQMAAEILSGLGERGILLALQAEKGPQGDVARNVLRDLNLKSQ